MQSTAYYRTLDGTDHCMAQSTGGYRALHGTEYSKIQSTGWYRALDDTELCMAQASEHCTSPHRCDVHGHCGVQCDDVSSDVELSVLQ